MILSRTTRSAQETQEFAQEFAKTLSGGDVLLLEGDLGSGKTTFSQGLLEALGAEKPYTSPTFVIVKSYNLTKGEEIREKRKENIQIGHSLIPYPLSLISKVHHIDTYRIESKDLLDLGWDDMMHDPNTLTILEWPERVRDILPQTAKKIYFKYLDENERAIQVITVP